MRRVAVITLLGLALALVPARPASAHASLSSTEPASGEVLLEPPTEVVLHFTEAVEARDGDVRVIGADGERVDGGDVEQPDGRTVVAPLDGIGDGGYVVAWKVVSSDGHPISGGFTWRVGESSEAVDPALVEDLLDDQEQSTALGVVHGVARFLVFTSLLLLVGIGVFVVWLWPAGAAHRRVRELLWLSWTWLAAGTVGVLATQWTRVNGLDTTVGQVWAGRLVLLVPAAVLVRVLAVRATWWRASAGAIAAALLATPALSGHADSGRWVPLSQVVDVAHLAAAAVWLGGIVVLAAVVLRTGADDAPALTSRFSRVATWCVAVVVLTGTFQSVRQVRDLDAIEEPFGRLLAIKIVVVLLLIGIASLARTVVRERAGDDAAVGVLRRIVGAEAAVGMVVVAVTALLVNANPSSASSAGGPFDETVVVEDVLVNVVVVPGTVGPTDIHLYVDDPAGGLTPPLEASGALALGDAGIDGVPVDFTPAGPGHWSAYDVDISIAGDWVLTIEVLLTEFDDVTATFTVPIGG